MRKMPLTGRGLRLGALLIVLPVVVAGTAAAGASSVPRALLGKYSRTISAKALARTGYPQGAGTWTITFRKDATVFVQAPPATGLSSYQQLTATSAGVLTLRDEFCVPHNKGTYRWKVTGKTLTLTNVNDKCYDRSTVMTGSWKRR